jgi:hypothetical protein
MIFLRAGFYLTSIVVGLSGGASLSCHRLIWPWEVIPEMFFFFLGSVATLPSLIIAPALLILFYVYLRWEVAHWLLAVSLSLAAVLGFFVAKVFVA